MIRSAYRGLSHLLSPLAPILLRRRLKQGREEAARLSERLGHPACARPEGHLIWLHAASVGEAQSVLRLIQRLREMRPTTTILITTGTVTSAEMLAQRLPDGAIHQFVPLDLPAAVRRFIGHWRPDMAIWIESELWPNLIAEMAGLKKPMVILNGRMSERSFRRWSKVPATARALLSPFDLILGQNAEAADRFRALGHENARTEGNLKYAATPLPAEDDAVAKLADSIGSRPFWIAASIHPGEDTVVASVHKGLKQQFPDLLTIAIPRHPARAEAMAQVFAGQSAFRSRGEEIAAETDFYLADTMGELGLFYRLSAPVFVGGSLVPHGGQNMLEPARFGRSLLVGPNTWNFSDVIADMRRDAALIEVENAEELSGAITRLLTYPAEQQSLGGRAQIVANRQASVLDRVLTRLEPLLPPS